MSTQGINQFFSEVSQEQELQSELSVQRPADEMNEQDLETVAGGSINGIKSGVDDSNLIYSTPK